LPHFGEEGCGPNGERIEKTKAKHISASIQANAKGRNLQYQFNHSLVLTPQASAKAWEQLLAREHREGQKADTVYAHVLASRDMTRVLTEARHLGRVGGFDHKLTIADWIGFH
jgi:excinuclease UvrABC helicase subunit UvrB